MPGQSSNIQHSDITIMSVSKAATSMIKLYAVVCPQGEAWPPWLAMGDLFMQWPNLLSVRRFTGCGS